MNNPREDERQAVVRSSIVSYRLASDVYACATDDSVVFLALARNKYLELEHAQSAKLVGYVQGWELLVNNQDAGRREARNEPPVELLNKMIAAGLLTTAFTDGCEPAPPSSIPRPETTLVELDLDEQPELKPSDPICVVVACTTAFLLLRTQPFQSVVNRARQRRERHAADSVEVERLRSLTAAFVHLQPLCYGARRKCVLDSLALLEFLALHRMYPSWVFGVTTGPFAAHCWVQSASMVCNDTPDHVRRYAPILVA